MSNKRYWWIKLKEDFFKSLAIKRLRKLAGGDTYTLIYLEMQLLAMKNDGIIAFQGVDGDIASEIALTLDEEVDNVRVCLQFLESNGMAEIMCDGDCFLPETIENTGSETDSAQRMRKARERERASLCDKDVTSPLSLSLNSSNKLDSNTELDINNNLDDKSNIYINNIEQPSNDNESKKKKRFVPPTVDEVEAYCREKGHEYVDPESFVMFYESKNWYIGKNKMTSWTSAVGGWNSRARKEGKPKIIVKNDEPQHTGRSKRCRQ